MMYVKDFLTRLELDRLVHLATTVRFCVDCDGPREMSEDISAALFWPSALEWSQTEGFGCYLIRYREGNGRADHIDPSPDGRSHVRVVALVQAAEVGGDLFVGDERVPLKVGDAVLFKAHAERHGVTPVLRGERLVLTIGRLETEDSNAA